MRAQPARRKASSLFQGLQLLLIQSVVCILAMLAVLCMRWFGGEWYDSVSSMFRSAMLEDTLVSAVTDAWQPTAVSAMTAPADDDRQKTVAPLVGGVITSPFGERDGSFHEGVDIAAQEGTPLKALKSGVVTVAQTDENGYGKYLVVTCENGEKYLYAHCSSMSVAVGETVCAGDTVAYVGNTGRSSGSHVHIEWICNGKPTDPLSVLPEETYV